MELTNEEMLILFALDTNAKLDIQLYTEEIKNKFLDLKLVVLDTNSKWSLTDVGKNAIKNKIVIKYPLNKNVGSFDDTISTMSPEALNALFCSLMNHDSFSKINKKTKRTFFQHLLNSNAEKDMGWELINKWKKTINASYDYLKKFNQ